MKTLSQMLAEPRPSDDFEETSNKPQSPVYLEAQARGDQHTMAWCKLSREDQIASVDREAFERRLQGDAQRHRDAGMSIQELEAGYKRAIDSRARYMRSKSLLEQNTPCKKWRHDVEPGPTRDLMDRLWKTCVADWVRGEPTRLAYLASPSAPCECFKCNPGAFRINKAHNDEFGPMDYPETNL